MSSTSELNQHGQIAGVIDDSKVPTIDAMTLLTADPASRPDLVATVRQASLDFGFFYIDTTAWHAMEPVLEQMDDFFDLPADNPDKQAAKRPADGLCGWTPLFEEPSYQPGTVAYLEAFDFGVTDVNNQADPGIWTTLPDFRHTVTGCWDQFAELGRAVLSLVSEAAGLDPDFLPDRCASQAYSGMRLLHYPEHTGDAPDNAVGLAAHTDFEAMSMIYQTAPGLDLLGQDGRWYHAPFENQRITILYGDMIERWTNGVFNATGHRVSNTPDKRHSIIHFMAVDDEVIVEPLAPFVSNETPAKYPPIQQLEHIINERQRADELTEAMRHES